MRLKTIHIEGQFNNSQAQLPLCLYFIRTTSVVIASIGSAASVYVLVAITGYLSFGDAVKGNIVGMCKSLFEPIPDNVDNLKDIPSIASTIGKAAIVILVMFSYPLQVHPCRASVDAVLKWRPNSFKSERNSPNSSPSRTVPLLTGGPARPVARNDTIGELRFAIITTVIIILSYTVAMTVSSLDKVLAYVGSTGSTSISFILPGLFYYKISAPESIHHQRLTKEEDEDDSADEEEEIGGQPRLGSKAWRAALLRKLALGLAIYGIFVMILCLGTNLFFTGIAH
jgi:amino acid permease